MSYLSGTKVCLLAATANFERVGNLLQMVY